MEIYLFSIFPAAPAQEYTDPEKVFSQIGNNTELAKTYRICLAKGELLVCKINHDQVSAEQKMGLTKVSSDLFLMLINPIAPKLPMANAFWPVRPFITFKGRSYCLKVDLYNQETALTQLNFQPSTCCVKGNSRNSISYGHNIYTMDFFYLLLNILYH